MKRTLLVLTAAALSLGLSPALAQLGGPPSGPRFDGALAKVLGENSAFTATLESLIKPNAGDPITLPGKIAFDAGRSRFEMNMSGASGLKMPAGAAEQMKSMGLDQITTITLPEKKLLYLVYPGLQSYVENPLPAAAAGTNQDFKVSTTELGKDTVNGHPCVENKVLVTDSQGATSEFTVWNATDLKNFPVKIIHAEKNMDITLSFTDVSLAKPDASTFELPAGYTRYDNMQTMMQAEMMKKMGGGLSLPPGH